MTNDVGNLMQSASLQGTNLVILMNRQGLSISSSWYASFDFSE